MAGIGLLAWIVGFPDTVNEWLVVIWIVIAVRGIYKAFRTLLRSVRERRALDPTAAATLRLLARGNVRRSLLLVTKLTAFLTIGIAVLAGVNNVTMSRSLVVLILLLMWGGAELDDDELDEFDHLEAEGKL